MRQRGQIRRTLAVSYWQRTIVLKLPGPPRSPPKSLATETLREEAASARRLRSVIFAIRSPAGEICRIRSLVSGRKNSVPGAVMLIEEAPATRARGIEPWCSRQLRSLIVERHRTRPQPRSTAAPLRRAFFNECPDAGVEIFAAVAGPPDRRRLVAGLLQPAYRFFGDTQGDRGITFEPFANLGDAWSSSAGSQEPSEIRPLGHLRQKFSAISNIRSVRANPSAPAVRSWRRTGNCLTCV